MEAYLKGKKLNLGCFVNECDIYIQSFVHIMYISGSTVLTSSHEASGPNFGTIFPYISQVSRNMSLQFTHIFYRLFLKKPCGEWSLCRDMLGQWIHGFDPSESTNRPSTLGFGGCVLKFWENDCARGSLVYEVSFFF